MLIADPNPWRHSKDLMSCPVPVGTMGKVRRIEYQVLGERDALNVYWDGTEGRWGYTPFWCLIPVRD